MILSVCPNPSVDKYLQLPALKAGKVNRSSDEQPFPGGKGVHVALAVNELGEESSLLGFWGGPTGKWIKETCSSHKIDCYGPDIEGWNRTCITINSHSEFDQTEILEQGPAIGKDSIDQFLTNIKTLSTKTMQICISGSWPQGTPDDIYLEIKKICTDNHQLWIDASAGWLKRAADVHPFGIHINLAEAKALFEAEMDPAEYALKLLDYCKVAAVTNGADGLYLASEEAVYHAACHVDHIISTVGSGDCLLAGLLVAQHRKNNLKEMAIFGAACGTANCIRKDLGMLYKEDAERLMNQVICRKIS